MPWSGSAPLLRVSTLTQPPSQPPACPGHAAWAPTHWAQGRRAPAALQVPRTPNLGPARGPESSALPPSRGQALSFSGSRTSRAGPSCPSRQGPPRAAPSRAGCPCPLLKKKQAAGGQAFQGDHPKEKHHRGPNHFIFSDGNGLRLPCPPTILALPRWPPCKRFPWPPGRQQGARLALGSPSFLNLPLYTARNLN